MAFTTQYAPKHINDYVFESNTVENAFKAMIHNAATNSQTGIAHLLFEGTYGSGKTNLAQLLPEAMVPGIQKADIKLLTPPRGGARANAMIDQIRGMTLTYGMNGHGMKFVILDEFDQFPLSVAQEVQSISGNHKYDHICFVGTTNYKGDVHPPMLSRMRTIKMNVAPAMRWLSRARYILQDNGLYGETDDKILKILGPAQNDNRKYLENLESYAQLKTFNQAQVVVNSVSGNAVAPTQTSVAPQAPQVSKPNAPSAVQLPPVVQFNSATKSSPQGGSTI